MNNHTDGTTKEKINWSTVIVIPKEEIKLLIKEIKILININWMTSASSLPKLPDALRIE